MARILTCLVLLCITSGASLPASAAAQACPDPSVLTARLTPPLADVRYLADDALEGREAGTAGARCAAGYLAERLASLGLEPAARDASWFQTFPLRVGSRIGPTSSLEISGEGADGSKAWGPPGEEWTAFGFSPSATVEGTLVHVGSGLEGAGHGGPEAVDLSGRIAVMEGPRPGGGGRDADPHFQAAASAARGAVALIVLLPPGAPLPDPATETRPGTPIPVAAVGAPSAATLREAARSGGTGRLGVEVEPVMAEARNVVALLPGADLTRRDETVVVGAHYDHLGWGGEGSLAPDVRAVHNGADDNASGTAALLEVAHALTGGPRPARSVLFVAFTAEEKGLLGSVRYVEDPLRPLAGTVAMINMDMVGRLRESTVTIYGVATAEEWETTLSAANASLDAPLELSLLPDGFGPSDHSSFYGAGIPVLHVFTNTHTEYHRPDDDWETIDAEGIGRVARLVTSVTRRLAGTPGGEVMALTPVEGAGNPHAGAAPSDPSAGRGYGPYLGTIPDMSPIEHGVRLTGVREGSPAEAAGLRGGDVIVGFAGRDITDLYAFTYALRDHAPGDEVEIVVLREGGRVTVAAVLGERR